MEEVVLISSGSEDDEITASLKKKNDKYFKQIWAKVKDLIFTSSRGLSDSNFPHQKFVDLCKELQKCFGEIRLTSMKAFLWKSLLQWIHAMKLSYDGIKDLKYDDKFNLTLVDLMAQYINYKCKKLKQQIVVDQISATEVDEDINETLTNLHVLFNGNTPYLVMTLLKVDVDKEYAKILYPIFRKFLSNKHLHQSNEIISYLRLVLCYKQWKKMVPFGDDKEEINVIAQGILPASVPSVDSAKRPFANISDVIDYAKQKGKHGTRILLTNKSFDLEEAIKKYFKQYESYISRGDTSSLCRSTNMLSLADCDPMEPSKENDLVKEQKTVDYYFYANKKNLTRIREIWRPPRKDKGTKIMTSPSRKNGHKHLSKPCDNSFKLNSSSKSKKESNYSASNSINLSRNSENNKVRNIYKVADVIELCSSEENTPDESARKSEPVPPYKKQPKSVSNRVIKPQSHSSTSKVLADSEKASHCKVLRNVQHKKFRKKAPKNTQNLNYSSDSDDSSVNAKKVLRGKLVRRAVRSVSSDSYASDYDNIDTRKKFGERVLQVNRTLTNVKKTKQPCIQGEVSSTTFPDIHVPTPDQPTTSSLQCHQSSLEVHSSSNLQDFQNGREVGSGVLQILKTPSPDIREKVFMTDPTRPSLSTMTYTDYESLYRDMVRAEQKSIDRPCIANFNSNVNYHRELLPYECGPLRLRNFQSTFPLSPEATNIDSETKKLKDDLAVENQTVVKENTNVESVKFSSQCATSSNEPSFLKKSLTNRTEVEICAADRKSSSQKDKFIQTEIEEPLHTHVPCSKSLEAKAVHTEDFDSTNLEDVTPLLKNKTEAVTPPCHLDVRKIPNKEIRPNSCPISSIEKKIKTTSCSLLCERTVNSKQPNKGETNKAQSFACSIEEIRSDVLPLQHSHVIENVQAETCSSTLTNEDLSKDDSLRTRDNDNKNCPSKCLESNITRDNESLDINCKIQQAPKDGSSVPNEPATQSMEIQSKHENTNHLRMKDSSLVQGPVEKKDNISQISSEILTTNLKNADSMLSVISYEEAQNSSSEIENRIELLIEEEICDVELDEANPICAEEENALLCEDENIFKGNAKSVQPTYNEAQRALEETAENSMKNCEIDSNSVDANDNDKTEAFLRILDECLDEDTLPEVFASVNKSSNTPEIETTFKLHSSCSADKMDAKSSSCEKEEVLQKQKEFFSPKEQCAAKSGELKDGAELLEKQQHIDRNIMDIIRIPCGEPTDASVSEVEKNFRDRLVDTQMDEIHETRDKCSIKMQADINDGVKITSEKEMPILKRSSNIGEPANRIIEPSIQSQEFISDAHEKSINDDTKLENIFERTNAQESKTVYSPLENSKDDNGLNMLPSNGQKLNSSKKTDSNKNVQTVSCEVENSPSIDEKVTFVDSETKTKTDSVSLNDCEITVPFTENDFTHGEKDISDGNEEHSLEIENFFKESVSLANVLEQNLSVSEQVPISANVEVDEKIKETAECQVRDLMAETEVVEKAKKTCSDSNGQFSEAKPLSNPSIEICINNTVSAEDKPKDSFPENDSLENKEIGLSTSVIKTTMSLSEAEENISTEDQIGNAFISSEFNENLQEVSSEVEIDSLSNVDAVPTRNSYIFASEFASMPSSEKTSSNRKEIADINVITETRRQSFEKQNSISISDVMEENFNEGDGTIVKITHKGTVETGLSCENDCTEQTNVDIDVNKENCDEHELVLQDNVVKRNHTLEQTNDIVKESTSNVSSVIDDSYEVQKQIRDESCVNDTTEETDFFDKEKRKEKEDDEILLHEMEKTEVRSEVEIFSVSGNDCQMFETTNKNLIPKDFDEKISPEICSKNPTLSRDAEVEKSIVDPFCVENDLQSNYNNEVSKDINEEIIADMRLEKNTNSNDSEVDKALVSASSTKKGVIGKNNSRVPKDLDIPSEKDTYSNDNEVEKALACTNEKDLESKNNDEVPKEIDEEGNIIPCAQKPEILSRDAVETVMVSESNRKKDLTFKNKDQLDACNTSKDSSKSDSAELAEIQNVTIRNSTQEADTSQISRINALQYVIEDTEVEGTHKKQSESGDMTKIQSDESSEHNMETIAENEPLKMFCGESKFGVRESCQVNKKPITSDCDVEKIVEPIISCAEEKADKSGTSTTVAEFQKTVDNKDLEVLTCFVKNDDSKVERKSTVIEYGTKVSENPNQNSSCIVEKTKESYKILEEVKAAKQLEQTFSEDKEQQAEDMYNDNQIETDKINTQDQMEVDRDLKQRTSIKIIKNVATTINDERTSSTLIEENTNIILNENQNTAREALLMEKRVETRVEANSETNIIEKHKDDQKKKEGDIKTIVDASESILSKSNENSMNIESITEGSDARIALHNVSSLQNRPTVLTTIAPYTASQGPLSFSTDNLEKNLQPDSAKLFFDPKNGNDFSSRCERDYLGKLGKAVRQSGGSMNKMLTHDKIVSDMDQTKFSSTDETIASKSQSKACLTEVNSTKLEEMNLKPLEYQQNDGSSLSNSEFICPSNDVCSNFFLRNKKSIPNEKALVKSPEENYERTPFKLRIKRRLSECANNLENLLNEDKSSPCKLNIDAPNCPSSTLVDEARSECENLASKQFADEPNIVDTVGNKKTLSEFDFDRDNHVDNVISEIDRIKLDGLMKQKVLSPKRRQSSCNEPISSDETEVDIEKQQIWMNKLGLRKKPNEKSPFTREEPKDKKEKGRLNKLIISRRETTTSTGIVDTFISRINAVSENVSDTAKKGETVSLGPSYNLTLLASEAEKLTPIFDTVSPAGEESSKSPRSGLRSGSTQSKKKAKSSRSTRNSCTEVEKEEIELNVRNALQTVQNKPKSALKNPNSKQRKEKRTVTFADTLGAWKQKKLTEFLKLLRSSNGRLQLTSNLKDKLSEVLMILSEYSKEYDIRPSELCIKNDEFVVDMAFDEAESCKEDLSKKGLKTSKKSVPKKDIEQIIGELILKTLQKNKSLDQLAPPKIDYEQGMKIIQNSAIVEYIEPSTNTIPMDLVDDRDQPHLLNEHKDVADDSSEFSLIIKTPASKRGRKPKINNQKVVTVMEKKCDDIKSKKFVGSSKKQLTSLNLSQLLYPASEGMVRSKDQFADITVISDNDSSDESLSDYLYKSNQYLNAVLDNKPLNLKNNSLNVRDTTKNTGKYMQSFANAKPLLSPNNFLSISIDQCSATQILDKKKTKKSSKKGKQEAQRQEDTASGQRVFGNAKPVASNVEAKASTVVTEAKFKTLLEPEIIIENASGNVNLNKREVHTDFLSPSNCTSIEEIVCKVVQDVCRKQSVLGLSMHNINNSEFQNIKSKSRKSEIKPTTPSKGQKTCAKPTDQSVKPISATKSKLHSKAGKSLKISSSNKSHSNAKVNQIPESKTASPSGKSTISHQIDPTSSDLISHDLLQKEGVSFDMEGNVWIHSSTSTLPNQNTPVSNVLGPNNEGNIFWDVDGNILAFNLCLATNNAAFPIKEARIEEVISSKPDALVKPCEDSMNSQESTESVSENSIVNHTIHKTLPLCERKSEKLVGSKKRKSKRCKQLTPDIVTNENSCNESFEDASKVTQDLLFKHTEQSETVANWTTPINGLTMIEPVLMRETPTVAPEISSVSPSIINYKKEGKNPSLRKSRKVGLLDMVEMLNNNRKELSAKEKSGTKKDENNSFQTKALDLSAKIKPETEPSQEILEIRATLSDNQEQLPHQTISNPEISTLQEHLEEQNEPKSTCNELKATEDNVEIVANDEVNENLKRGDIEMSEKQVSITTEIEISLNSVSDIVSKESAETELNTDVIKDKEPIYDPVENEIGNDRENKEDVGEIEHIESDKMDRPTLLNISVEGYKNGNARQELSGEAQLYSLDTNNELTSNVDAKIVLPMNLNNTDVNLKTPQEDAHNSAEKNGNVEEVIKKDHLNDMKKAVDTEKNVVDCKNLQGISRKETSEKSGLKSLDVLLIKDEPRMPTVATKASKKDMTEVLKLMETIKEKETEQEHKIREDGNKASPKTVVDVNLKIDATEPLFNNAITADSKSHSNDRKLKSIKLKISNLKEDNKIRNKELRKKHKKNKKRKESVTKEDASTFKAKDIVVVDKTVVENVEEKLVLPKEQTLKNERMKDEIMIEASCKTIENALSESRTSPKSQELLDTTEMSTNVELLDATKMSTNVELLDTTEMSTNVELLDTTEMSSNVEPFDTTKMSTNVDNNKPPANDTCRLVESECMKKDVTSNAEQNEASTQTLINSNGPHQLDSLSIENSVTQEDGKNSLTSITESIDENLDIAAEVEIVSGDGIDAEVGKKLEVVPSESTTAKASGNEAIIDKKIIPLPLDVTAIKDDEHKILLALKDDSVVQPAMFESNNLSTKPKECLESTKVIMESMNKLETDIVSLELKDAETNASASTNRTIEKVISSPPPCSENIENQGLIIEDVDKYTSESTDTLNTDTVKEAKNDSISQSTNNTEEINDEPAKVSTENNLPIEKASDFPVHSFIYSDEKLFLDKNPNFESCDLPENLLSAESPSYQKNKLRISNDKLKSEIVTSTIENEDNDRSLQCTIKSELLSLDASSLVKDEKRDLTLETACTKLCYVKLRKLKNVRSVSNSENEPLDGETKLLDDTSYEMEKSDEKIEERVVENKVVNEGLLDADQVKNSVSKAEPPTVAINTAKKKARKRPLHSLSDDAEEEEDLQPKIKKQSTKKRIVCDRWENEERLISKYTNLLQLKNMFASHLMQFLCTFERSPTLEVFFTFNKILVTFIYETLSSEDYSTVSCARTYLHLCTKTKQLQSKNIDEVALDEIEQKYTLLKKKRNEFRSLEKIKLLDDFLQHFKLNKKNLFTDTWIRKNYSSIQRHLHLEPVESHFKAEIPENVEYVTEANQTAKAVSENSESIQESAKISPPQETSAIKFDSPAVEVSEIVTNNSTATNKDHTQPIATTEENEGVKPTLLDAATMLKDLKLDSNKPCEQVIEQNTEHFDDIDISGQTCVSVECDNNVGAEEIIGSEKDANGESPGTGDCDADMGSPSMLQNSEGDITSTINNTMMKLIQIGNLETISSEMDPFSMTNSFAVTGDMNSSFKTTDTIGFDENLDNSQNHGSEDWPDLLLESIMEDLNAQKDYSGKKKEDCMISGRYDVRNYFPEASLGAAGVLSPLIENNMTELVSLENENMENTSARASTDQSVNMNDILKESLLLRGNNLAKCEANTNGNFVLNAVNPFDILIPLESGEDIASQSNVHISSEPAVINFDLNTSNDNNLNALDFVDYVPEVVDTILTSLTLDTAMSKCSTRLPEIQPQSTICHSSINQVSVTTTSATSATASSKENLHSPTNIETKTFHAPTAECVTSVATTNSTPKVDSVQNKFLETNSTMTVKQFYIPEKDLREASTSKVNSNHDTYISSEDTVDANKKKSPGYTKPKPPTPKPQVTQITSKLKSHPFPSWKTVSPVKRDIQSSIPISKAEASNSSKNISLTFTQSSDGENATGQSNRQCKQVTPSTLLHMPDLEAPQNITISASKRSEPHPSVLHVKKEIIVASQKLPSPFPTIDDTQYICSSFGYSSEVEVETSSPGPVAKKRPRGNCSVDVSQPLKKPKVEESKTMDPFDKLKSEPVNVPLPNNAKYRKTYSKPAVVNTHVQVKPSAPVVSVMSAVSAVGSVLSSKVSPMKETSYSDSVKNSSPNKVKIHVTDCEILAPPTTANKPVTSSVLTTSTSAPVVKHQTSVANLNVRRPSDSQTVLSQSIKKRTETTATITSQGKIVHAPPSSVSYKVFTYNPPTSKSAVAQNASNRIKFLSKEDDSKNNYKRSTSYLNDSTKSSQSVYKFKAEESKPKKIFSQPAIASTKTYTHTSQARNMNGTEAPTSSLRHNDPKRTSVSVLDRKRRHSVNESHRSHDSSSKSHSRHGNVQRSEILDSGGVSEDPKVTPLTVRTAWDYKPISTDEILEHLAKQKKLKSN